jgi:hypothetical protein
MQYVSRKARGVAAADVAGAGAANAATAQPLRRILTMDVKEHIAAADQPEFPSCPRRGVVYTILWK